MQQLQTMWKVREEDGGGTADRGPVYACVHGGSAATWRWENHQQICNLNIKVPKNKQMKQVVEKCA